MIRELEEKMWRAAQARDKAAFLELVDVNAGMVCGGDTVHRGGICGNNR